MIICYILDNFDPKVVYMATLGSAGIHSFIHSFVHSFIRSFVHSFIRSFVHSFIRSFVHSFVRSFVHSFIRSFVHSFIHSFIHRKGLMLSFVKLYVLRQRYDVSCCFSSRMMISYCSCLGTGDCNLCSAVHACVVLQELSLFHI